MSNFGKNLRAIRLSREYTQERLANEIGVSPVTMSRWESAGRMPKSKDDVDALCRVLRCTEQELLGYVDGFYSNRYGLYQIKSDEKSARSYAPVFGTIAAGDPREAIELSGETHWVSPDLLERYPDGFFLRVSGDSMDMVIPDGAFCFIAPGAAHSGDIAAIKVNGDDATVKRFRQHDGIVILEPESHNPEHRRRIIDETDPDAPDVRILGKVVWADISIA